MHASAQAAWRWSSLGERIAKPAVAQERSFGLVVGGVLLAIAAFSAWRGRMLRAEIVAAIGFVLVIAALTKPAVLRQASAAWARLGHALGWFNSRVLLTLLFFVVFLPAGLVSRILGGDPLDVRRRVKSLWLDYPDRLADPNHYKRFF
jgi:hypothetical protein